MLTHDLLQVCIAVAIAWLSYVSGQRCRSKYTIQQQCGADYGEVLDNLLLPSPVACAQVCDGHVACRTFVFHPATKVCKTYWRYWSFPPGCDSADMVVYGEAVKATCHESWIGDTCDEPYITCSTPKSTCRYTCMCGVGFSYRAKPEDCLAVCPAPGYGSKWTYEDYLLSWNAAKSTVASSFGGCMINCEVEIDFLCIRIEYYGTTGECLLFTETGYTQPDAVTSITDVSNQIPFLRNCY